MCWREAAQIDHREEQRVKVLETFAVFVEETMDARPQYMPERFHVIVYGVI